MGHCHEIGLLGPTFCRNPLWIRSSPFALCVQQVIPTEVVCGYSVCSMADAESIDQKIYFEQACRPKCAIALLLYRACAERIQGDEAGHKHCTGQYFDYWSCVDKCVASKLFATLK